LNLQVYINTLRVDPPIFRKSVFVGQLQGLGMPPQLRATQQFGHGNKGNGVSGGWNLGLRVARGGGALKRSAATSHY